jgi:hypothetical protein
MRSRSLIIFLLLITLLSLYSCSDDGENESGDNNVEEEGGGDFEFNMPPIGEKGFSDVVYSLPNVEKDLQTILAYSERVEGDGLSLTEAIEITDEFISLYSNYETMLSHAEIRFSENKRDKSAREDFLLLSENFPRIKAYSHRFLKALYLKGYAEEVEKELFFEGFFAETVSGETPSESVVELQCQEARFTVQLLSLSPATVQISYDGITASLEETIDRLKAELGEGSQRYENAVKNCKDKYAKRLNETYEYLSLELIKIRCRLASELGYESYSAYVYGITDDYTVGKILEHLDATSAYAQPIYSELSEIFDRYFYSNSAPSRSANEVNQELYKIYSGSSDKLGELFGYMISSELYSIKEATEDRRYKDGYTARESKETYRITAFNFERRLKQCRIEVFTACADDEIIYTSVYIISSVIYRNKIFSGKPSVKVGNSFLVARKYPACHSSSSDGKLTVIGNSVFGISERSADRR